MKYFKMILEGEDVGSVLTSKSKYDQLLEKMTVLKLQIPGLEDFTTFIMKVLDGGISKYVEDGFSKGYIKAIDFLMGLGENSKELALKMRSTAPDISSATLSDNKYPGWDDLENWIITNLEGSGVLEEILDWIESHD